jgi:hypothetical protein
MPPTATSPSKNVLKPPIRTADVEAKLDGIEGTEIVVVGADVAVMLEEVLLARVILQISAIRASPAVRRGTFLLAEFII